MAVRSLPEYKSNREDYIYVSDTKQFVDFVMGNKPSFMAVDTETYFDEGAAYDPNVITRFIKGSPNNMPFGVSFYFNNQGYWVDHDLDLLRPILEDESMSKIFHNSKYDIFMFKNMGIEVRGDIWDTMIMIKLIDEEFMCKMPPNNEGVVVYKKSNKLKDLAYHFLEKDAHEYESLVDEYRTIIAKNTGRNKEEVSYKEVSDANHDLMKDYAIADTDFTYHLYYLLYPLLSEQGLFDAYEVDINATMAVIDIERNGIRVDVEQMKNDEAVLTDIIEKNIHAIANIAGYTADGYNIDNYPFNPNSDVDMVSIFEKCGIGIGQWRWFTDKGELSTDKKVMKELMKSENKDIARLAECLIDYRKASKIRDTYITGVYMYIQNDGKVHPDFWVCPNDYDSGSTKTGRMSSSNPNFQNIPKKPIKFTEDNNDDKSDGKDYV